MANSKRSASFSGLSLVARVLTEIPALQHCDQDDRVRRQRKYREGALREAPGILNALSVRVTANVFLSWGPRFRESNPR